MGPVEEERWRRTENDPAVDPPVRPVTPGEPVGPAVPPSSTYYSRTTIGGYDPRAERVIWFVTGLIAGVLAIRFVMKLLGASTQADFVRFIYGVTGPLVGPFRGIFVATGAGNNILEPESLIAIAIYLLIGWALVALIRILLTPRSRPVL
jgi:uncharacterized protein YggT (Ycf19 family)